MGRIIRSLYLLAIASSTTYAITLSDFQPINGFSDQCTQAYNTPLVGCTASDFKSGSCSTTCISFLEALTKVLNTECRGTSAFPNTLIGLFFSEQGTSTLCPNVIDTSGEDQNPTPSAKPKAVPTSTNEVTSSPPPSSPARKQSALVLSVPESSAAASSAAASSSKETSSEGTSSASAAATTSKTSSASAKATVTSSSQSQDDGPSPPPDPPVMPSSTSSTTSTRPSPTSTSSGNNNAQGGGLGTILDIGSSAPPNSRFNIACLAWTVGSSIILLSIL